MKKLSKPVTKYGKITAPLLLAYVGIFLYTLSKHIGIMDISLQEKLGRVATFLSLAGCFVLLLSSVVFDHSIRRKSLIVLCGILIIIIINLIPTGYRELLYIFIIIYSIRNLNLDRVVRFTYICVALLTIIHILLVCAGGINDFVSIQTNRSRHCLGFSSWTVLPFQYISLVMGYTLFSKKPIKWYVLLLLEGLNYYVYMLTDVATAFMLLTIFIIIYALFFNKKEMKNLKKKYYLCALPSIMAAISFMLDYLYSRHAPFMDMLNIAVNNRLALNQIAYSKYGIHFLSAEVNWVGIEDVWNYFVVDNSYVNILMTYGISGLILVMFVYTVLIKYCIDSNRKLLLLIIIIDLIKNLMFNRLLSYQQTIYIIYIAEFIYNSRYNHFLIPRREYNESFNT